MLSHASLLLRTYSSSFKPRLVFSLEAFLFLLTHLPVPDDTLLNGCGSSLSPHWTLMLPFLTCNVFDGILISSIGFWVPAKQEVHLIIILYTSSTVLCLINICLIFSSHSAINKLSVLRSLALYSGHVSRFCTFV